MIIPAAHWLFQKKQQVDYSHFVFCSVCNQSCEEDRNAVVVVNRCLILQCTNTLANTSRVHDLLGLCV